MNVKEKSLPSKKAHPLRWGKCQKATLTFTFFSLSTLFLNKNLPKPTGCHFVMEICFDKKFSNQLYSLHTNISALDSNRDLAGSGVRMERGYSFQALSEMYRPVKGPRMAGSILIPGRSPRFPLLACLADLGRD